ncbi:RHS repeat-associated core domain-containing protein [Streptomyces canus]|uniref:RHS repeat-associated core domain-containing protein n=1 Tax=Streptomyces canus TaxID=58343 RepID=UPI003402D7E1
MPDGEDLSPVDPEFRDLRDRMRLVIKMVTGETTNQELRDYAALVLRQRPDLNVDELPAFEVTVRVLDQLQSDVGVDISRAAFSHAGEVIGTYLNALPPRPTDGLFAGEALAPGEPLVLNQDRDADPVVVFSGEFVHDAIDLQLDGAGMDFAFERTYRSQATFFGPLGANWDHIYNMRLRADELQVVVNTGDLRQESYTRHFRFGEAERFNYFVPPDGVHAIIRTLGDSYVRRAPGGTLHLFEPDQANSGFHRLRRIQDRFGNALDLAYASGLLSRVTVNNPRRTADFDYDNVGRISAVTDHTGRAWRYSYDDYGDLVAVSTPHGATTCFEYTTAVGPLTHGLARITDAAGRVYLENEYGSSPGGRDYNRVVRQRQGGGATLFEYDGVEPVVDRDYSEIQRPAHRTVVVDRAGQAVEHVYNAQGNELMRAECFLVAGAPTRAVWRHRYDADGQLTATLSPEGVLRQHLFGREWLSRRPGGGPAIAELAAEERQGLGRLLASVRRGSYMRLGELDVGAGAWADIFPDIFDVDPARDVIAKFVYEPVYGQLVTESDPRFTDSPAPGADEHPLYEATLTRYEYAGPPGDTTRLLARIRHPEPTASDGVPSGPVEELFAVYDDHGRLLRRVDPLGVVTEHTYVDDLSSPRAGQPLRAVVDTGGLAVTTLFDCDDLGRVVAVHSPRATGDGRFVTLMEYDALDRLVRITSSPPFEYEVRRTYDATGALVREERDLRDEAGVALPNDPEVRTFCYDEELHTVREGSGADGVDLLVTHHRYDAAGRRVWTILPAGNREGIGYDVRGLAVAQTRGLGTVQTATTRTEYDLDGRAIRTIDARGFATALTLDALGRTVAVTDPLGTAIRRSYDKAGNLTLERIFERGDDGGLVLLTRTEFEHDLLGRQVRVGVNRFDDPPQAADLDAYESSPGPGELQVTSTFHDVLGRITRIEDPLQRVTTFEWDALGRLTAQTDPLGNRLEHSYDAHGNRTGTNRVDLVRDPGSGAVVGQRVFPNRWEYDELDRLVAEVDALGNVTRRAYDSRNREVSAADALGGVVRTAYDVHGRQVTETRERTATGLGGGLPLPPAVTRFSYDRNGNLETLQDPEGRITRYEHDALDRQTGVVYPDGMRRTYTFDSDDHLIEAHDPNGLRRSYTVDPLGQVVRMEVDPSGVMDDVVTEGATFEVFEHDGLGRRRREVTDACAIATRYNSLGWPIEETVDVDGLAGGPFAVARTHRGSGAIESVRYPDGRLIRHDRDQLDRLIAVEEVAHGMAHPGGAGGPGTVASFTYAGRQRARCDLGNGASTVFRHDRAGRVVEIAHASPSGPQLTLQYLIDGVGNIRIRNELGLQTPSGEALAYDSQYHLSACTARAGPVAFDPAALRPAAAIEDPVPNAQAVIDALIGDLELPPGTPTFAYDLVGNRTQANPADAPPQDYTVNGLDQYTQRDAIAFSYDRNGNLLEDDQRAYRYDHANRLVRVIQRATGATLVEFRHDSRGRRVVELRPDGVTHLIYDGPHPVAEYRNGVTFAHYVYEDGVDRPVQIATQGTLRWYATDLVGSVRLLTGSDGEPAASYRYDHFGADVAPLVSAVFNPLGFAGHRRDGASGTYDFRARTYDPGLGRFCQRDPLGMADETNLYSFVGNNPLSFADPDGHGRRELSRGDDPTVETLTLRPPGAPLIYSMNGERDTTLDGYYRAGAFIEQLASNLDVVESYNERMRIKHDEWIYENFPGAVKIKGDDPAYHNPFPEDAIQRLVADKFGRHVRGAYEFFRAEFLVQARKSEERADRGGGSAPFFWLHGQAMELVHEALPADAGSALLSAVIPSGKGPKPQQRAGVRGVDVPIHPMELLTRETVAPKMGSYRGVTRADRRWAREVAQKRQYAGPVDVGHVDPFALAEPSSRVLLRAQASGPNRADGAAIAAAAAARRLWNDFNKHLQLFVRPKR